jgi:tellurite resistance protein TehA-like permease
LEHSNGIGLCGVNRRIQKNNFKFSDFALWFPNGSKSHLGKFIRKWFGPYRVQYVLHNNMVLLLTFINFEPNPMLVNINKLKLYKFIEYKV